MSLANYSDLVSGVASWTHRSDLTAIIPDFISLAELRMYYGCDEEPFKCVPLRLRIMQEQDTGTASSGSITIPSGYLETIRLAATTGGAKRVLTYRAPHANTAYETETGDAKFYTVLNEAIKVAPQTATYTHDYYKRFDALTSIATTNALMTAHPNLYLYATLIEAFQYIHNVAKAQWAYGVYRSAVNALQSSDKRQAYGHGLAVVAVS